MGKNVFSGYKLVNSWIKQILFRVILFEKKIMASQNFHLKFSISFSVELMKCRNLLNEESVVLNGNNMKTI